MSEIQTHTLSTVRNHYEKFLDNKNYAPNTIQTSLSDAFYIWRHKGKKIFWETVLSSDFENIGRDVLNDILLEESDANLYKSIQTYMSHLRRFRKFLSSEFAINLEEKKYSKNHKSKKNNNNEKILPSPSVEEVEFYLKQWQNLEDYRLQEESLNRLFFELSPHNKDILDILIKVSVLNDFYSTNIFKVFPVAKHILELDVDERLKSGDVSLVDDIKRVTINDKTMNFYSFATKYCSHHNPIDYPIYDSYVDEVLRYYRNTDKFYTFKNEDLKNYETFKLILSKFSDYYDLGVYSIKELDKYLWQLGKTHFNRYK